MKKILGLIAAAMLVLPIGASAQTRLRDRILELNPLRAGADFSVSVDNTNRDSQEGLFSIEDEHGTAHFFRGTHALNNNVIFAGHQWKILRIEGNGNIRLIYNGECPNNECTINGIEWSDNYGMYLQTGNVMVGTSVFNTERNHNRFVGYMFGSENGTFEEQHANTYPSTIKTFVDNWFSNNITGEDRELVVNNTRFCNDRSIADLDALSSLWGLSEIGTGLNQSLTLFGTMGRLFNHAPSLICPRAEDRLNLSIGLLTDDEAVMGGFGVYRPDLNDWNEVISPSVFLSPGYNTETWELSYYWTMSPNSFEGGHGAVVGGVYGSEGLIYVYGITGVNDDMLGVRPVLALDSNVLVTGDGSAENPFVVTGLYEAEEENNNNESTPEETPTEVQPTSDGVMLAGYVLALTTSLFGASYVLTKRK